MKKSVSSGVSFCAMATRSVLFAPISDEDLLELPLDEHRSPDRPERVELEQAPVEG